MKKIFLTVLLAILSPLTFAKNNVHSHSHNHSVDTSRIKIPEAHGAKYKAGTKITIQADHMHGMKGAKGIVVRALATPLYAVDYYPTNKSSLVKNYKWVTYDEFKDQNKNHKVGDSVELLADHMAGMKGAKAKIVSIRKAPAYIVDVYPTNGGAVIKNHAYVSEDEIK